MDNSNICNFSINLFQITIMNEEIREIGGVKYKMIPGNRCCDCDLDNTPNCARAGTICVYRKMVYKRI